MKTITPREAPPSFPRQISNSYFKGARMARENILFGVPLLALEAATAQPGEQIPTLTGRLAGLAASPVITGLTSAGLTAAVGIPPAAAAIAAVVLAGYVSTKIEDRLIKGISWLSKHGEQGRRLAFGGDFQDSQTAQQRRQRAVRDLAGAAAPARQWLGQEAMILHR